MVFAHDTEIALGAAVQLVNTAVDPDTLESVEDLSDLFEHLGYTGRHDADQAELVAVRALRPRLRELLVSERDEAVELVNAILAETQALPRLVRHDDLDWHLHCVPSDVVLVTRILAETAGGQQKYRRCYRVPDLDHRLYSEVVGSRAAGKRDPGPTTRRDPGT